MIMTKSIFKKVKDEVTTRMAAERYVGEANRYGMMCCPFHDDKHPSLKIDKNFICFGCGERGDVIKFVQTLFYLTPKEAAVKIADDFGVDINGRSISYRRYMNFQKHAVRKDVDELRMKQINRDAARIFEVYSMYRELLRRWEVDYMPKDPDKLHRKYVKAITEWDYVQYVLDVISGGTDEDRECLVRYEKRRIDDIEAMVRKYLDEYREAA